MSNLISLIQAKFRKDQISLGSLPFPSFVTDTRSSPVEVRFELDVRNDRNLASWHQRYRLKAFQEGRYGAEPVEETVSAVRAVAGKPHKAGVAGAASKKVHHLHGSRAA